MSALDAYFEEVLGMTLASGGGCARSPARERAHLPFLAPHPAMELVREGAVWRSLSRHMPPCEGQPLEALGAVHTLEVYTLPQRWQPRLDHSMAQLLDGSLPVMGGLRLPQGPAYGVADGGCIVSWAAAGAMPHAHNITVETAPAHRRRGLAAICLSALCTHLAAEGLAPFYACSPDNPASRHTAIRAGFVLYGTWRYCTAITKEDAHATL